MAHTIYYLRDGHVVQQIQVPHSEATDEEKQRWVSYQQQHVKRERFLSPEQIIELLNKLENGD